MPFPPPFPFPGARGGAFSSLLYQLPAHRRHRPHHIDVAFALILGPLDDLQQAAERLCRGPVALGDHVDDVRADEHLVLVPGPGVDRRQRPVVDLDLLQLDLGQDVLRPRGPRQAVAADRAADAGEELHCGVEDVGGVVGQEAARRTVAQVVFVPLEEASWLFFVTCALSPGVREGFRCLESKRTEHLGQLRGNFYRRGLCVAIGGTSGA